MPGDPTLATWTIPVQYDHAWLHCPFDGECIQWNQPCLLWCFLSHHQLPIEWAELVQASNAALKDALLALHWAHDNIEAFGGDVRSSFVPLV